MTDSVVGVFGKLPALGDFVHRGFSRELAGALDRLTQTAIQSAVAEGSDRDALERHTHSCVIHIRPGAIADSGFVGCMVPSCDRVGRFFPLFAGLEVGPPPSDRPRAPLSWVPLDLAVQLCQTAYAVQLQNRGPDELLRALPSPSAWDELLFRGQPFVGESDTTVPVLSPTQSQFAFEGPESRMHVLDRAMCNRLPMFSELLGSVVTEGAHFDRYFATRSLLSWSSLAALFDARWEHWGWDLVRIASTADDEDATVYPPTDGDDGVAA